MRTVFARSFFSSLSLSALLCFGFCTVANAAPRVKPPLEAVRRVDVSSVIGRLVSADAAQGQFEFQISRVIAGEAVIGKVTIAASADILSRLAPETDYTLIVLHRVFDPKKPGRIIPLEVWRLFDLEGASPPIFLTTESNTALFDPAHADLERSANYLASLVNDLSSSDVQLVDLSTAEIIYSDALRAALTPSDKAKLVAVIGRTDVRGITRARVLSAASSGGIDVDNATLDQLAKQVLLSAPTGQLPWIDSQDELVFAALNHFSRQVQMSTELKVADISRWLQSPNPALVEQAATLAVRIDANAAADAFRVALNYALLPKDARSTLKVFLLRSKR